MSSTVLTKWVKESSTLGRPARRFRSGRRGTGGVSRDDVQNGGAVVRRQLTECARTHQLSIPVESYQCSWALEGKALKLVLPRGSFDAEEQDQRRRDRNGQRGWGCHRDSRVVGPLSSGVTDIRGRLVSPSELQRVSVPTCGRLSARELSRPFSAGSPPRPLDLYG